MPKSENLIFMVFPKNADLTVVDQFIATIPYVKVNTHGEVTYDDIEMINDGQAELVDMSVDKTELAAHNVSVINMILPGSDGYTIRLNCTLVRTGKVAVENEAIIRARFDSPVSGRLVAEKYSRRRIVVEGSGALVMNDWLRVESSSRYKVSVTIYEKPISQQYTARH